MVVREGEWSSRQRELFWQFVRGRLAERRVTQAQLAQRLHLDRSVLTRRLNGQIGERPSEAMVEELVAVLQLGQADVEQLRSLAGYRKLADEAVLTEVASPHEPALASPPTVLQPAPTASVTPSFWRSRAAVGLGFTALTVVAATLGFVLAVVTQASTWLHRAAAPTNVVLRDDFADPSSGWPVGREPEYGWERAYVGGEYVVFGGAGLRGMARANRTDLLLRNFTIETNVRLPQVSTKTGAIVGVRLDGKGYLRFEVWPESRFCAFSRMTTVPGDIYGTRLVFRSDYQTIHPGTAVNRIGIRAQGSTFVGLVNGEEALRVDEPSFLEGGITLGAINVSDEAVEARFDDLVVTSITTVR